MLDRLVSRGRETGRLGCCCKFTVTVTSRRQPASTLWSGGVAIDPVFGAFALVTGYYNHAVRRIDLATWAVTTVCTRRQPVCSRLGLSRQ